MSRSKQKKKPVKTNPKKNRGKKSIWKKIILAIVSLGFIGLLAGGGLFIYYASSAPKVNRAELVDTVPSQILDRDGNLVKEIGANAQNRDLVDMEEVPAILQDAIISIEDRRFYKHIGVDPIRIVGALFANIQGGGISQGGSTITQQLIKLSYFSHLEEDQTLKRKAQEAWMSVQLEQELNKDEILALYINKVYMGNNAYGMGTAAEYYFGKELNEINLSEAAILAGMPQAPNFYDPYISPEETEERRNLVLDMMVENEKISQAERDEAASMPITENLVDHSNDADYSLVVDSYIQMVMDEVREKTGLDVEMGGLTIQTNLDMDAQQHLYDIVNSDDYIQFPDDELQTAVTMVDVETGALNAVIGNRKINNQLAVNYADQTVRSVGSTIKPLIDFGPAIEYLNYSTGSLIVDEEWSYPSDGTPLYNYDRLFKGDMTLRESLVDSRNVPSAKLLQEVGFDNANSFLNGLGIEIYNDGQQELVDSNAIGGEISNVDLAAAYGAFANGGTYYEPYTVQSVTTSDGEIFEFSPNGTEAMKDSTAYMVTDMLKDVIPQSAPEADVAGLIHAGKTGTTDYLEDELESVGGIGVENIGKDSWFVGYTTNYAISVWLGYAQPLEYGNYLDYETRKITRYIYSELMGYVSQDVENTDWTKPDSVVEASMEKYTSPIMKPGPNTPSNMTITELFVKGYEPTQISKKYGEKLEAPTGLKAVYNKDKDELTISWDAYKSSTEDDNRTPQYTITAGSQTQNTTNTEVVIKNPAKGNIKITLLAKIGSSTSPAASISITIEEDKEKEEEEENDEENSSSESSSESSSSSSEESSSEESSEEQPEPTPPESEEAEESEEEQQPGEENEENPADEEEAA